MKVWIAIALVLVPAICFAGIGPVPHDTFLGISPPSASVHDAREKALQDVAAQVLRTIGAEYSLSSSSSVTGSAGTAEYHLSERFSYSASGFIQGLDRNVVSQSFEDTPAGIVCWMWVRFSSQDIERFRQLSLGAKVHAVWAGDGTVELREVNGVPVVLTEYTVQVKERNTHAGFLSYYVMKVSSGESREYSQPLSKPVHLSSGNIERVWLAVPGHKKTGFQDMVLGTRRSVVVTITGRDVVGRPVTAVVRLR